MAILKKIEKKADAKEAVKQASKEIKKGPLAKEAAGESYRVLLTPAFSEKADRQQALGKYVFMVATSTNKIEIMRAVRDLYGVKPVSVRIIMKKGKNVRFGKTMGRQKNEKKAIVTLRAGDSITFSEAA